MLLAIALVAPPAARAQCGRLPHASPAAASRFDHLLRPDAPGSSAPGVPTTAPARKSPCPGGSCSAAPAEVPASSPAPPPKVDQWGCLAPPIAADPGPSAPLPLDDRAMSPVDAGLSVFHPPRA